MVNSGQNTPPQSLYWWSKPVYPQTRAAEQTATVPEYPRNIRERLQGKKAVQTTPEKDGIQRMVDRAAKRAEGKGVGYDRWAAVHNLKQMAATVAAYGQYGYSPEELDAALVSANADLQDSLSLIHIYR